MSTGNRDAYRMLKYLAALSLAAVPAAAATTAAEQERSASSTQIVKGGRDGARSDSVRHVYGTLKESGTRDASRSAKPGSEATSQSASNDFWFFDADVVLFNDDDGDGYYHGIDLLFDADTVYDVADVYAAVFLSYEGGPWNEYAVTDDFTLYGATSDDEYVIVTELETGYPAGNYDLLIELYDAWDGSFLASFGPSDTSALSYLLLEDFNRDTPIVEEVVVVGHSHGGGHAGWLALVLLPLAALRQVARRRGRRA